MNPTFYTCPPARAIAQAFNVDPATAAKARSLMKGEIRITGNPEFPATNAWIDQCYHKPKRIDLILSAMNELFGTSGVEAFCTNGDRFHAIAEYLNTGDTYAPTILFRHDSGTFRISSWGDFFERNEKRLGLQTF